MDKGSERLYDFSTISKQQTRKRSTTKKYTITMPSKASLSREYSTTFQSLFPVSNITSAARTISLKGTTTGGLWNKSSLDTLESISPKRKKPPTTLRGEIQKINLDFIKSFQLEDTGDVLKTIIAAKKKCETLLNGIGEERQKQQQQKANAGVDPDEITFETELCQLAYFRITCRLSSLYCLSSERTHDAANVLQRAMNSPYFNEEQKVKLRLSLGNIHASLGTNSEALKQYKISYDQVSLKDSTMRAGILKNISNVLINLKKYDQAAETLRSAVKIDPDLRDYFNLMKCLREQGDYENMKRVFSNVVRMRGLGGSTNEESENCNYNSENSQKEWDTRARLERRIQYAIAMMMIEVMDTEEVADTMANTTFSQLVPDIEVMDVISLLESGKLDKALNKLSVIETKHTSLGESFLTTLSGIYLLLQNAEKAEEFARRVLKSNPASLSALNNLAVIESNFKERHEEALSLLSEVEKLQSDAYIPQYNAGIVYGILGDYKSATNTFLNLARKHCGLKRNEMYKLSEAYYLMGNHEEARNWSEILISTQPPDPSAYFQHGLICYAQGNVEDAIKSIMESYKLHPTNVDTIDWLGSYYVDRSDFKSAISHFKLAVTSVPTQVRFRLLLGSCYRSTGDLEKAKQVYTDAHEKFPSNTECVKHLISLYKSMQKSDLTEKYIQKLSLMEKKEDQRS